MDFIELENKYPGINMVGYTKWSLFKEIENFILSSLRKCEYLEDLEL